MFELDASIVVIMALVFGLLWAVRGMFHRPMGSVLEERHLSTAGTLEEAKKKMLRVEDELNRYRDSLHQARAENYKQQEEQRRLALEERQKILHQGRERCEAIIDEARRAIAAQTIRAKEGLTRETEALSTAIVKQLLS